MAQSQQALCHCHFKYLLLWALLSCQVWLESSIIKTHRPWQTIHIKLTANICWSLLHQYYSHFFQGVQMRWESCYFSQLFLRNCWKIAPRTAAKQMALSIGQRVLGEWILTLVHLLHSVFYWPSPIHIFLFTWIFYLVKCSIHWHHQSIHNGL